MGDRVKGLVNLCRSGGEVCCDKVEVLLGLVFAAQLEVVALFLDGGQLGLDER